MSLPIPVGSCNFHDLALGSHARKCGCQHFWAVESPNLAQPHNRSLLINNPTGNAWCFCGHHACYHDSTTTSGQEADHLQDFQEPMPTLRHTTGPVRMPRQNAQRPSTGLGHSPRTSPFPSSRPVTQAAQAPSRISSASVQARSRLPSALGLYVDDDRRRFHTDLQSVLAPSIPPTRRNSTFDHGDNAPSIQQPLAKQPLSHAALEQAQASCPPIDIPQYDAPALSPDDVAPSATEVATPSIADTPALRGPDDVMASIRSGVDHLRRDLSAFQPIEHHLHPDGVLRPNETPQRSNRDPAPAENSLGISKLISEIASLRQALAQTPSVAASIHGLSCRVDALENFSFSHVAPVEDLGDRLEQFDGRLLDMEGKVEDLEKLRAEYDHILGSPRAKSSTADDVAIPDHARGGNAIQRLQTLEDKLYDLETLQGPSADQPLDVEIVLLPWGRDLQGVWVEPDSAGNINDTPHNSESSSRSTLRKDTLGSAGEGSTLPIGLEEWRPSEMMQPWKVPRACGPQSGAGGRIYERLQSRGFVRSVSLIERTPQHVHSAICTVFGDLLPSAVASNPKGLSQQAPLAFKSPFIPLRKVHKSSRLRFLAEAELATPMLWTSAFLSSSIFMKAPNAGLTRLYITTPSAYMQQDQPGWTWQKLRELPRLDAQDYFGEHISQKSPGVSEADAMEPCWQLDSRLDPPASTHTSFTSNDSFQKQLAGGSFGSSHPLSPQPTEPDAVEDDAAAGEGVEEDEDVSDASDDLFSDQSSDGSVSELGHHAPITPITDLPPSSSRQSLFGRRTASLPASDRASHAGEASQMKRAAISFDAAVGLKLLSGPCEADEGAAFQKRRRLSREPEASAARSLSRGSRDRPVQVRELSSGKSPRDPAQHAYATPYSWSAGMARANWQGTDADTDADGDLEMSDEDDSDYEEDSELDPEFVDEQEDPDDELEHALTRDEEEWAGVGDDNDADAPMSESDENYD